MKILSLLLILLVHFTNGCFSQGVSLDWATSCGSTSEDFAFDLTVDEAGNTYTVGTFTGPTDFDPGAGVFNLTPIGLNDFFIQKLDPSGNFMWAVSFGTSDNDFASAIDIDESDNIVVTGTFVGTVDFDPSVSVYNLTSIGIRSQFLLKLDSDGNLIWVVSWAGNPETFSRNEDVVVSGAGNIYVIGSYIGTADFNPSADTYNLTSVDESADVFISKFDSESNFIWAKTVGGTNWDLSTSCTSDLSDAVIITGSFLSTDIDFDPGIGIYELESVGGNDVFVLKLDADGNFVWAHRLGGTGADIGHGIDTDPLGNIFTTGRFSGTVDFDPSGDVLEFSSAGSYDIYILKLTSTGELVWATTYGSTGEDQGLDIQCDEAFNVFITGLYKNTVDFDPSADVYELTSSGNADSYLLKLNDLGEFAWAKSFGGPFYDRGKSCYIDNSDNVYLCGEFRSTCDFDPGPGVFELTAVGDQDFFVLKLDPCSSIFGVDEVAACDSLLWIDGITYYTDNDTSTYTATNVDGCDSIVTLNLTILSSSATIDSLVSCDSLTWINGITYYESNDTATSILTNVAGCDSVITLNLTINYPNTSVNELVACDSLTWIDGITYYEDNTSATYTLTNVLGCDSLVTLNLEVNYSTTSTDNQTACDSYIWIDGIEYFEDNTTATFILTNSNGCDSLVILNLNIDPIDIGVLNNDPTLTAIETDAEYQWLDCLDDFSEILGATSIDFTPEENGEYTVEVTKLECIDTSDCYVVATVGFGENETLSEISIYPNPTKGMVNMDLGDLKKVRLSIYSIKGDLVYYMDDLNGGLHTFDLDLESGIYFIEIKTSTTVDQFKLILN